MVGGVGMEARNHVNGAGADGGGGLAINTQVPLLPTTLAGSANAAAETVVAEPELPGSAGGARAWRGGAARTPATVGRRWRCAADGRRLGRLGRRSRRGRSTRLRGRGL